MSLITSISLNLLQFVLLAIGLFMAYMILSALSGLSGGRK